MHNEDNENEGYSHNIRSNNNNTNSTASTSSNDHDTTNIKNIYDGTATTTYSDRKRSRRTMVDDGTFDDILGQSKLIKYQYININILIWMLIAYYLSN